MQLNVQKRLAGQILKCSKSRVKFDQDRLSDIKEAITKFDLRGLVSEGAIVKAPTNSTSKVRARKLKIQKSKGRRSGAGSRKGKKTARLPKKETWMKKVRLQRAFLKELKENSLIDSKTYQMLYRKSKGGFFRSKRHIKVFMTDKGLFKR